MTIKWNAATCNINGQEFDKQKDHKTVVALIMQRLMQKS